MSKFKLKLKLTGLEIEVEGSRDDVPAMVQSIGQQMSGLLQPIAGLADGEHPQEAEVVSTTPLLTASAASAPRKRKVRRNRVPVAPPGDSSQEAGSDIVSWAHDPLKWGNPVQGWTGWMKALWFLYVASMETDTRDMSAQQITRSFNQFFRTSGLIHAGHVARDLGKRKAAPALLVGEDGRRDPSAWFLTDRGIQYAQQLVLHARGEIPTPPAVPGA